jgi:hypothetical protein
MEGKADTEDFGHINAYTAEEAVSIIAEKRHPKSLYPNMTKAYREWGLSAELVAVDFSAINELSLLSINYRLLPSPSLKTTTNMQPILNTQANAISAIKLNSFIIGSVDAHGAFSISSSPREQSSASQAREECKRLAKLNPGKLYVFMQLNGAEMIPQNTISI